MEFANTEVVRRSWKIKIKDFQTATREVKQFRYVNYRHSYQDFNIRFDALAYPIGVDEKSEGWLIVFPYGRVPIHGLWSRDTNALSCTVSVIDVEGNSRFPQSFQTFPFEKEAKYTKYLQKSFILSKADELLPEGELTLLSDFYIDLNTSAAFQDEEDMQNILENYLYARPKMRCIKNKVQKRDSNNSPIDASNTLTVFDLSFQILTLPLLHESRKRFGAYGIGNLTSWSNSVTNYDNTDITKHIWTFDTHPDRFILSFDERWDSVGLRLLEASPFIRRCVNTPMKEGLEKHVEFPNTDSRTFILVLYFLEKGVFLASKLCDFLNIYEMSHLYAMKNIQQKCAEEMVKRFKNSSDLEEIKRISAFFSDEYLTELLDTHRLDHENLELFQARMANSDCYT